MVIEGFPGGARFGVVTEPVNQPSSSHHMHNNTDPDENNNPNSTATLAEPAILSTASQHLQEEDNEFNATVQQNQTNKRIKRKNKQKKNP
jgi:hypothetical protein